MIDKVFHVVQRCAELVLQDTFLSPVFILAVIFILLLERLIPARPQQRLFSVGFLHDCVWVALGLIFVGAVVAVYGRGLRSFYDAHLGFLTVKAASRLPEAARFVLGVLAADLLAWFQHWLKHKVPWFWRIHAVHHSQREINLFTDFRFHFFEYLISTPIVLLPLMMFSIEPKRIPLFALLQVWQSHFYHANIRANFGPLRYIFVTPQSHRIHHSIKKEHIDKNFGVMFSFWDRLFRTQHASYRDYPETGIHDASFPLEKKFSLSSLMVLPFHQLIYPFFSGNRRRAAERSDG